MRAFMVALMSSHLTPAAAAFRALGSYRRTAQVVGLSPKTMFGWLRPSKGRLAGDIPSSEHIRKLLLHARANGIPLTAEHLIFGCDAEELAALLAASRADIAAE